jgi:hydroxymethylbilane synthase
MLPAPAQGAIGIECRADDAETAALLGAINNQPTYQAVLAERAFCRALGGTCHSPVAAYARVEGDEIAFTCEILSEDGEERLTETARFPVGDVDAPAALGRKLIADAPPAIRRLFE